MTISPSDLARAAAAPFDANTGLRTLDLTTADAAIDLVAGVYEVHHTSTGYAVWSLTGVTTSMPPATGAAEVTGGVIPVGAVATIALPAATTLHAKVSTGTAVLFLQRKAAI